MHHYLRRPPDWFLWALDEAGYVENKFDHRPVHYDAATVHEAVLRLDPGWTETTAFRIFGNLSETIRLVIGAAETGQWPEPLDAVPRPSPIEPPSRSENYGWYLAAGPDGEERRDYWIRSAETVVFDEAEWAALQHDRKRHDHWIRTARHVEPDERKYPDWARKRMPQAPGLWALVSVPYCPIAWSPDPDQIAAADHRAKRWREARARLCRDLAGIDLRAHVLRRD